MLIAQTFCFSESHSEGFGWLSMSFELITGSDQNEIPSDLHALWPIALSKHGILCEIHPHFRVESWNGGFLPFKVETMPSKYCDMNLSGSNLSGFEVSFSETSGYFRSAAGRPTIEFALMCLAAAELAVMIDGEFIEAGGSFHVSANEASEMAIKEITETLKYDGIAARISHPFEGWD